MGGDCFELLVGAGGVQLRRYVAGSFPAVPRTATYEPEEREGQYQVMSKGALRRLRFAAANLPLDKLGERWLWVTLTAPENWRPWMGDDRATKACLERLRQRMWRRWGGLIGIWVNEFQERGAPHFHVLMRCPDSVTVEDYGGLMRRQDVLRKLSSQPILYRGRPFRPTIGVQQIGPFAGDSFGGEFAETLRKQWSEAVTGGTDGRHFARGVDIEVPLRPDSEIDRRKVLCYLGTEMGKSHQKQAPSGYGTIRRWWDLWGRQQGFVPQYERYVLPTEVGELLSLELRRWVEERMREARQRRGLDDGATSRAWRAGTGATAIGLIPEEFEKMRERVEAEVEAVGWSGAEGTRA